MMGELQKRIATFLNDSSYIGEQERFEGGFERTDLWAIVEEMRTDFPQDLLLILKNILNVGEGVYRMSFEESKALLEWFERWLAPDKK